MKNKLLAIYKNTGLLYNGASMRNEAKETRTYFLYARKSSESEDRQVQSIDDQITRLTELGQNLKIKIKEVFTEAKSAKQPNCRPIFSKMLKMIEKGEADGILCWQINRLSRNPIDSGTISWMLQRDILKSIQTIDRQYLPDDNVLLFNVESGMANQYIIDLRKNSRRGMVGKAERGWLPSIAPMGYVNDKLNKTIIPDKERFVLVRKMWDMMLSGQYNPREIRTVANGVWKFRTLKYKGLGDNEISNSLIYKTFSNIFYTGMFEWGGKLYQGNHQPLITLDEYDRVQELLGRKGKPRMQSHEFAYTGLIRCATCGSMFTATEKTKLVKTAGQYKKYVYYHCSKKKKDTNCDERPLTVNQLEDQIVNELKKYSIYPLFLEWGLAELNHKNRKDNEKSNVVREMKITALNQAEKQRENLIQMRYKDMIDDELFLKEKDRLSDTILKLKHQLNEEESPNKYFELTEQVFTFCAHMLKTFETGTIREKRQVLYTVGSNCTIKGKKLLIEAYKWLLPIKKKYPSLEAEYKRLELNKSLTIPVRNMALASIRQHWLPTVEEVRTAIQNDPNSAQILKNFPPQNTNNEVS